MKFPDYAHKPTWINKAMLAKNKISFTLPTTYSKKTDLIHCIAGIWSMEYLSAPWRFSKCINTPSVKLEAEMRDEMKKGGK